MANDQGTIPIGRKPKGDRMEPVKIMPCLDMKEGRVVKGVNFVNLRDAGDPVKNAEFYQAEGADELAMLDIAATLENAKRVWIGSSRSPQ